MINTRKFSVPRLILHSDLIKTLVEFFCWYLSNFCSDKDWCNLLKFYFFLLKGFNQGNNFYNIAFRNIYVAKSYIAEIMVYSNSTKGHCKN